MVKRLWQIYYSISNTIKLWWRFKYYCRNYQCGSWLKVHDKIGPNKNTSLKKKWKYANEIITYDYFEKCSVFTTEFIDICNNNKNIPYFVPKALKKYIDNNDIYQGAFSQVIVIRKKTTIEKNYKSSK